MAQLHGAWVSLGFMAAAVRCRHTVGFLTNWLPGGGAERDSGCGESQAEANGGDSLDDLSRAVPSSSPATRGTGACEAAFWLRRTCQRRLKENCSNRPPGWCVQAMPRHGEKQPSLSRSISPLSSGDCEGCSANKRKWRATWELSYPQPPSSISYRRGSDPSPLLAAQRVEGVQSKLNFFTRCFFWGPFFLFFAFVDLFLN